MLLPVQRPASPRPQSPRAPLLPGCGAANAAGTLQPKSLFYMIPKPEKTTLPGPCRKDFTSGLHASHPGIPDAPGTLIGNRSEGPKFASGRASLCLALSACVRSHSRDSQALELTLTSPKCALRINYLPEIPKAGNWDIPSRDKVKPRTVLIFLVLRTSGREAF